MNKAQRIEQVNEFIKVIGDCGRRFFYREPEDRYGHFFLGSDSRLRWREEWKERVLYLSKNANWDASFSHGGTLRTIVELLAKYIRTGELIHPWYFRFDGYWGYGEEMQIVTDASKFVTLPRSDET